VVGHNSKDTKAINQASYHRRWILFDTTCTDITTTMKNRADQVSQQENRE
jgi:hypothetical protein